MSSDFLRARNKSRRPSYLVGTATICGVLLIGCQTPRQPNPLAYIPQDVSDFKQSEFVDNRVLVIQTCLADRRIRTQTLDVSTHVESLPLTVCQRRQNLGQPCPSGWQSNEPKDTSLDATQSIRVWSATGDALDIAKRWIPTGHVFRSPNVNSAGGSHSYLRDTTVVGQPVFESEISSSARELFAWEIRREVMRNGTLRFASFWFIPPAGLQLNEFSPWRTADVEEPEKSTGWSFSVAMANNADFPKSAAGPDSPRVRFGLFTYRRYNDADRLYLHLFKNSYNQAKAMTSKSADGFQILRNNVFQIPAC